jgi:formylglycine-generating enzyme required for sulfatase activity
MPTSRNPFDFPSISLTLTQQPQPSPTYINPVITTNDNWEPIKEEFSGVTMVLVPAGCFMMGSETGRNDEQPVDQVCIGVPFWLDKFEVTQADFERLGGVKANTNRFDGEDRPVEQITWFEAEVFCREQRGGRLPTEAEWEFAARGSDGLMYPWRGEFVSLNVVGGDDENETAQVGENIRTGGVSWVGAYDLSGNVWEWVSSVYRDYPYNLTDGREDLGVIDNRVLRGGSWFNSPDFLRSTERIGAIPSLSDGTVGFRCARSVEREE